jgi:hypothetical protein
VSQQQLALFAAQATLLRVQSEARVQRVNLHLALGGNFADGNEARAARHGCRDCGFDAPPSPPEPVTDGNLRAAVGDSSMESKATAP